MVFLCPLRRCVIQHNRRCRSRCPIGKSCFSISVTVAYRVRCRIVVVVVVVVVGVGRESGLTKSSEVVCVLVVRWFRTSFFVDGPAAVLGAYVCHTRTCICVGARTHMGRVGVSKKIVIRLLRTCLHAPCDGFINAPASVYRGALRRPYCAYLYT